MVKAIVDIAVGATRPDLTLLLQVSHEISERRRLARQSTLPFMRDRIEEADQNFFDRVAKGYLAIAAAEPQRVRKMEAAVGVDQLRATIWKLVEPGLRQMIAGK
jgi:dTMP kinase